MVDAPSSKTDLAGQACANTDRHLWPQVSAPDAPYEALFVTASGGIGINIQGNVIVKPLREWHRLAGGTPGRALGDDRPSNQRDWRAGCECNRVGLCYRCQAAERIERLELQVYALTNANKSLADRAEGQPPNRHTAEPPAAPLTWDTFWQRVRESGWNPTAAELRDQLRTAETKSENTEGEVRVAPHVGPGGGASTRCAGETRAPELSVETSALTRFGTRKDRVVLGHDPDDL